MPHINHLPQLAQILNLKIDCRHRKECAREGLPRSESLETAFRAFIIYLPFHLDTEGDEYRVLPLLQQNRRRELPPQCRDGRFRAQIRGEHAIHRKKLSSTHLASLLNTSVVPTIEVQLCVPVQRLDLILLLGAV